MDSNILKQVKIVVCSTRTMLVVVGCTRTRLLFDDLILRYFLSSLNLNYYLSGGGHSRDISPTLPTLCIFSIHFEPPTKLPRPFSTYYSPKSICQIGNSLV